MNIISLFDESGNALRPWAEGGYICYALDILNVDTATEYFPTGGSIHYISADLNDPACVQWSISMNPVCIMGFPPCTDLAVSGAAHFASKRGRNPNFQSDATNLAKRVGAIGDAVGCPWFAENPVSVLATLWRKPDVSFHPHEFGGYLPPDDVHPRWPDYINPRDAYPKKTCLWTGGGWKMPDRKHVTVAEGYSAQHRKLGGKTAKTKQIRSETPRGFAIANYLTNNNAKEQSHDD